MNATHRHPDRQTIFLVLTVAVALAGVAYLWVRSDNGSAQADRAQLGRIELRDIPFDGQRAYQHLVKLCEIGPRVSGSRGMQVQQKYLADHFERLGGNAKWQTFSVRHPQSGAPVRLANLIVEWHPERLERILLCAHYDTRPYPDRDPNPAKRRDPFIGANDGASGCAVLAELAEHMPGLNLRLGVDFVLFDAEELVYDDDRDEYFLGSTYFAQDYAGNSPVHHYRWGVLLDMVGDADLQIYPEQHSMRWRDTRPLVNSIWRTARRIGVSEFVSRPGYEIRDDHLPLRNIAKIPTCVLIDFEYGARRGAHNYWHTTEDTPDKCSALSLAKVGWVVLEWLRKLE